MGRVGSSGLVSHLFSLPATMGPYKPLASLALELQGQAEKVLTVLHFNTLSPPLEKMVENH